jgi:uncharacterized protein (DUF4415 family)
MKKEYDFKNGERGKFYRKNKIQKTLRIDEDVLNYFTDLSHSVGIPYQTLINLTLRKFAIEDGELVIKPVAKKKGA